MDGKDFLRSHGNGCVLSVDASPGAKKTEIVGINKWRGSVQIRIAAEPRDGEANEELVRFLAETFSVPRESVRLLKGERTSHKLVFLAVGTERARALLDGH